MRSRALLSWVVVTAIIIAANAQAQDNSNQYLKPTCEATFTRDHVNFLKVVDVDKDGVLDILAGTSVQGLLYDYEYMGADCSGDWEPEWTFNTNGDVRDVVVANLNSDGENEVLVNAVKSKIGTGNPSEYYFVLSQRGIEKWNFDKECGWSRAVAAADVDSTGIKNTIIGTLGGKICVIKDNSKDKKPVLWSHTSKYPISQIESAEMTGDRNPEVIALGYNPRGAEVTGLDYLGNKLWAYEIEGGIYAGGGLDMMSVTDLEGDGMAEAIVGTFKKGLLIIDGDGNVKESFDTGGTIVSVVHTQDLEGDGSKEIIVGSKPKIFVVNPLGQQLWSAEVATTVYSIDTADMNGDGIKDVIAGTTRQVRVYDGSNGRLLGMWTYQEEIQGMTSVYDVKDANAKSIQAADLDGDGDIELVVGFGWEEDQGDNNFLFGDVRVLELNKDYEAATTTIKSMDDEPDREPEKKKTTTTMKPEVPTTTLPAEYVPEHREDPDDEGGSGLCCIPALGAIFSLMAAVVAKV
ncbi:FG-GAP-like repeat-containing protein [Candidatus Altiarchaeota archaeon]